MPDSVDGLEEAFMGADMPSWDKMMGQARNAQPIEPSVSDGVYMACFSTPAGQAVLSDMYQRYVNVTIVEPGQALETHGIRQGQANTVFDIIDRITKATQGDQDDG